MVISTNIYLFKIDLTSPNPLIFAKIFIYSCITQSDIYKGKTNNGWTTKTSFDF